MNRKRFITLADAYGGDLARWPAGEQRHAEAWLESAPEAAAILKQSRELDRTLSTYATPPPSPDLQRRIVTTMLAQRRKRGRLSGWLPALGAMGTLAVGAVGGAVVIALLPEAAASRSASDALGSVYEPSSFGDLAAVADAPDPFAGL